MEVLEAAIRKDTDGRDNLSKGEVWLMALYKLVE